MEEASQSPRFIHKITLLQQARQAEKISVEAYNDQLAILIEEQLQTEELNRQGIERAQLWSQAKDNWKVLEEEQLHLRQIEEQKKIIAKKESEQAMQPYTNYRDVEVPSAMKEMQNRARYNRGYSNFFQLLIIVTSTVAAGIVNITTIPRLATSLLTIIVAIATGVVWIFKFKERSINSQQTADSIEYQRNLYRLGIKDYAGKDPKEAHETFATRVEDLKNEQNKRQQLLEQTSDKSMEGGGSLKTT